MRPNPLQQALLEKMGHAILSESDPNTVDTPMPPAILCAQLMRQETLTELLTWIHDHIRTLLTPLTVESLVHCLATHCTPIQLQRARLLINPSSPYVFDPNLPDPVVLIDTFGTTQLYQSPQRMQLYASHYSTVELYQCAGEIGGDTRATAVDCPDLRVMDFVKLTATGSTTGEVTDYSQVEAEGQSRLIASGCAEVLKKQDASVILKGSVRLIDHGDGNVQTPTPIAYLKLIEGVNQIKIHTRNGQNARIARLATQQERSCFCRQVGIHTHMLHNLRTITEPASKYLDELKQWICAAAEQIDPSLVNTFRSATRTTELLDKLVPHLSQLIPALTTIRLRNSFNAEQLAERQIFVNDMITPAQPLTGTFYVVCNQIIDQPEGTTGYYYHYAQAHVAAGTAYLYGHSVAFGERADIYGYENSLCYMTDGNVRLSNQAIASLHGQSQGNSRDTARLYGYDHARLIGYGCSSMLTFDEATVNGVGATAYAEVTKAHPEHKLHLISDPIQMEKVRQEGIPQTQSQLRERQR